MNQDLGGWLWLIITVGSVAVLGGALFYGATIYRQRSPQTKQRQDEATKRLYRGE